MFFIRLIFGGMVFFWLFLFFPPVLFIVGRLLRVVVVVAAFPFKWEMHLGDTKQTNDQEKHREKYVHKEYNYGNTQNKITRKQNALEQQQKQRWEL